MSGGELVIDVVGGPEAIPQRELAEAVRSGAIDMGIAPYTFYRQIVPASGVMSINRITQKEMLPGTPWYDFAVEEHAQFGLRFLGEASYEDPFYMFCTKPIKTPSELKGLRFRSSPAYAFLEALGITPIMMDHAEIYSALERGLIDGTPHKTDSVGENSLFEVMKYIIGPGYWGHGNLSTIANLDTFNKLPAHLQDILIQAKIEIEPEKVAKNKEYVDFNWNRIIDGGMEHIEWSEEDNRWFHDTIDGVLWGRSAEALGPEKVAKMKKLMGF